EREANIVGGPAELGLHAECRQTDSLERFVAALHEARTAYDAVIVNPGAWTHHERALHDAIEPLTIPVVEYHLSDVGAREPWRHVSVLDGVVSHVVSGEGAEGARRALLLIANELAVADVPSPSVVDAQPNR
ncbi:MAG: type II 3-dehydroquinate dehydratase, partial [Thermoleophilia bacterium]|nr:type II 3-dehydroquinate dehydratase [Thermoleophilia bacterium]